MKLREKFSIRCEKDGKPGLWYRSRIAAFGLFPLILTLFLGNLASAQTTTSTIEGTVRDANGALVAGAQVKASSSTLATERTVVTDAEGFYRIVSLPAGTYTLSVTQTGFAVNTSQLELTLNRTATFDVRLQVGGVEGNVRQRKRRTAAFSDRLSGDRQHHYSTTNS